MNKTKESLSVILWSLPKVEPLKEQVLKIHSMLLILKEFGDSLNPQYLAAVKNEKYEKFEISMSNVEALLVKTVEQEQIDTKLGVGSVVDFFSSTCEKESASIRISVGNSNPKLKNTFIINFPADFDFDNLTELSLLFNKLVMIFNPYWGCISSYSDARRYGGYYNHSENIPKSVFWINYWGKDIVEKLEISEKINNTNIKELCEAFEINEGYYIRLQKKPADNLNEEDLSNQRKINSILGLD